MDFPASTEDCDEKSTEMVRVLDNINLELSEGEIVGVIGRSGCGKTVLIHLIRGIDQAPTSGKIIYHISRCPKCGKIEFKSSAENPVLPAAKHLLQKMLISGNPKTRNSNHR